MEGFKIHLVYGQKGKISDIGIMEENAVLQFGKDDPEELREKLEACMDVMENIVKSSVSVLLWDDREGWNENIIYRMYPGFSENITVIKFGADGIEEIFAGKDKRHMIGAEIVKEIVDLYADYAEKM